MDRPQPATRGRARRPPRHLARVGGHDTRRPPAARPARRAGDRVRDVRLGPGAEFDRLRTIFSRLKEQRAAFAFGDDCALVRIGGTTLAASIDLSVEDVHFRTEWLSFQEIGWRATAAGLSDLAAEGAKPIGVLVSLGLPAGTGTRDAGRVDPGPEIMAGVGAAVRSVGAKVLGGDLVRSERYL